jgi:hypothetical protein
MCMPVLHGLLLYRQGCSKFPAVQQDVDTAVMGLMVAPWLPTPILHKDRVSPCYSSVDFDKGSAKLQGWAVI